LARSGGFRFVQLIENQFAGMLLECAEALFERMEQ
jgi:hypothetical protein